MILKGLNDYDICNYKEPSMFLIFPHCTFKCDKECGQQVCQNSSLDNEPIIDISIEHVVQRYIKNPLTHAIVCGGLEPFDTWEQLYDLCEAVRYYCNDPIIIYTGYNPYEINKYIEILSNFKNIIIKFGRFIPNKPSKFDDILGVTLASNNQYAECIS